MNQPTILLPHNLTGLVPMSSASSGHEDMNEEVDEEANHPEDEANNKDWEVLPSIPHSVAGPHSGFLEGNSSSRLGINNLSAGRIY